MNPAPIPPNVRKIWLPRTQVQSGPGLVLRLKKQGFTVREDALQRLVTFPQALEGHSVEAYTRGLFTSANGVRCFVELCGLQGLAPNFETLACLSDRTADAAREAFPHARALNFEAANATIFSKKLLLAKEELWGESAGGSPWVWPCSQRADFNFAERLNAGDLAVRALPCYAPEPLAVEVLEALLLEVAAWAPEAVILTSPSNVETLAAMGAFERLRSELWLPLGKRTLRAARATVSRYSREFTFKCLDEMIAPTTR